MEPLFEIRTLIGRETYRQIYWPLRLGTGKAKAGFVGRVLLSLLLTAGLVYVALLPQLSGGANAAVYLLIALYWVMFVFSDRVFARNACKRNRRLLQSDTLEVVTRFYEDRFEQDSLTSRRQFTVALRDVLHVHEAKDYYFLVVSDGYHCVDKSGFQTGSAGEFAAYLRAHCQFK